MLNCYQKISILKVCWGFKINELKPALGLEGKADNAVARLLERPVSADVSLKLAEALVDLHEGNWAETVEASKLADVLKEDRTAEFFAYMARLSGGKTFYHGVANGAANGKTDAEVEDIFVSKELIGLGLTDLKSHARSAFPPLLTGARRSLNTRSERCTFLYRLGTVPTRESFGKFETGDYEAKFRDVDPIYVIRRVPGRLIFDPAQSHRLRYEEHYVEAVEDEAPQNEDPYSAEAFVYAQADALTVFSRDKSPSIASRPSLMQLNWGAFVKNMGNRFANDADLVPGVITCESDLIVTPKPSTAYRTLLRVLPPELKWSDVREMSLTKRLSEGEFAEDGKTRVFGHPESWGAEQDDPAGLARPWSFYFERLNVIRNPIDILLCQRSDYRPNGHANGHAPAQPSA